MPAFSGSRATCGQLRRQGLSCFSQTLGHRPGDFPIAERIGGETISLPFYPTMPEEHIIRVAATLRSMMARGEEEPNQ